MVIFSPLAQSHFHSANLLAIAAKMSDVLKCKQTTVIKMRTGGGGAETKISTDLKSG